MNKLTCTLLSVLISIGCTANGMHSISNRIEKQKLQHGAFEKEKLLEFHQDAASNGNQFKNILKTSTLLEFKKSEVEKLLEQKTSNLLFSIPLSADSSLELELFRSSILTPDFSVLTGSGPEKTFSYTGGLHYWGIIKGDNSSVCAISIFENEIMGMISSPTIGNLVLGKLKGDNNEMHIFYNDRDLIGTPPINCLTSADGGTYKAEELILPTQVTTNCIRIYWEMNYDIFTDKGSVTNTVNYAIGLFNQSAMLYANDTIPVELSQVYVWDIPSPYTGSSTSTLLTQFQNYRNSFAGDIASLLGYSGGGGVAASISGLCSSNLDYSQCYSGVSGSFQNVPTYSWTVEVITHEQGHLLGSRHTHGCVWNGNSTAIDGCGPSAGYPYEGSCSGAPIPPGGGTIMSYCHLTGVGINFSLGFGPQPAAVILNNFNSATCLTTCTGGGFCSAASGMFTDSITTTTAVLHWTSVNGAVNYRIQYRVIGTTSWTLDSSVTNSYHAIGLLPGTDYEWQVQTVCGSNPSLFTRSTNFITVPLVCNAPTGLSTTNVTTQSAVLNWTAATAAIGYNVQYRQVGTTGWISNTVTATLFHVTGLSTLTTYEWQVQTICAGNGTSSFSGVISFTTLDAGAVVTIVLQPDGICGKDAVIGSLLPSQIYLNFGNTEEFNAMGWTVSGASANQRSLIQFDLSFIPQGSFVTSAYFSLFWNPTSSNTGHSNLIGTNNAFLKRITDPWDEQFVTWVNQPGTDTTHQVSFPTSTSNNQNYLNMDVTNLVQDFVNEPGANYGMMLQEAVETPYHSLIFSSSDHPNPNLHPKLELTYLPNLTECLNLQYSNCEGVDAEIGNCISAGYDHTNFGSTQEFDASAWTYSGTRTDLRSLIYWDFTSIPTNAVVTSATLSLFWNPSSANTGHSSQSGSNESYLMKITSPWDENIVTWNTQPTTDTLHQAYLPMSTSTQQDYTIDVKDLVQDMVSNPSSNYGLMLKLNDENHYRSLIFCSSDYPDPAKHPRIDVCYTIPTLIPTVRGEDGISIHQDFSTQLVLIRSEKTFELGSALLIYNSEGRLTRRYDHLTGNQFSFQTEEFAAGIYFVQIIGKYNSRNGKFLVR